VSKEEMTMTYRPFFTLLSLFSLAAPVAAQRIDAKTDRPAIRLTHIDRHPATAAAAKRTLARIDRAALDVCGASSASLREMKDAVQRTACWRDAVADAVKQIGDPLLTSAYADRTHRELGG
jgi:UrcA family protein